MPVRNFIYAFARSTAVLLVLCTASGNASAASCPPACGTPASGADSPRAIDCLFILRAAVGSAACHPECICRLTSGDLIRVVDALQCLRSAVSGAAPTCACGATTTTTLPDATGTCGESGVLCRSVFDCNDECFGSCQTTQDTCYAAAQAGYEACLVPCESNDAVCPRLCFLKRSVAQNHCDDVYEDCAEPCQTELCEGLHDGPRFEDTGLTVIDHQTQLEWEKKTADNWYLRYSWSSDSEVTEPDGTLFTRFLAGLNDCRRAGGCFAGHCDWRIPTMAAEPGSTERAELESLQKVVSCPGALDDCVHPLFGPVLGDDRYWSASETQDGYGAWAAFFSATFPQNDYQSKFWTSGARAVRSIR